MSAEFTPSNSQTPRPRSNPWMIVVTAMSASFMEVLDASAVNIALRHIAANFAVSTDEASWILTTYLIANALVVVASGWLCRFFGRRWLLLTSILIFTLGSALCGAAPNLAFLILARLAQGIGGGILQPVAQAVLAENFAPAKRGQAMAVYSIGVMMAPLLGPALGGWIAENFSWRGIFYINLPIGLFAAVMTEVCITDPPYLKRERCHIDYVGFALMALGLGSLQIILNRGQQDDWLSSTLIRTLAFVAIVSLAGFIIRQLHVGTPIVDLRLLRNRNFAIGALLVAVVGGAAFYGTITLLPVFLQSLLNYTATLSGETLAPRGVGALLGAIIAGRLIGKIDFRILLISGFGLLGLSIYLLSDVDLEVSKHGFLLPNIINGFAFGLTSAPLLTAALRTLKAGQLCNATALFNLAKNLGGSLGISVVTTLLSRRQQGHQTILVSHLTPHNPLFRQRLQQLQRLLGRQRAYGLTYATVLQQASLLAFIDCFRILALFCLLCAPLALCFKRQEPREGATTH